MKMVQLSERTAKWTTLCCGLLLSLALNAQPYQARIVGYIPTWGDFSTLIDQEYLSGFSHIMIAFANPDMEGNISFGSGNTSVLKSLVDTAHAAGCKISVSIGGGNPDINATWRQNMMTENRATLNNSLISLVDDFQFDGIDVDLEGDLILSSDYAGFVADLHAALSDSTLLTAAMATWSAANLTAATLDNYNFICVMSYDQTGPWTPNNPGQHSSYENAVSDIQYWKNTKHLPAERIVLGLPFYGYNFVSTTNIYSMTYREIVTQNPGAESLDQVGTIFYNGQPTITAKSELAVDQAGGVMIWELTQDVDYSDNRSLLRSIHTVIEPSQINTGFHPEATDGSSHVYPVPAGEFLMLEDWGPNEAGSIVNIEGRELWEGPVINGRIDVSALASGVYCLITSSEGKRECRKFIKQ